MWWSRLSFLLFLVVPCWGLAESSLDTSEVVPVYVVDIQKIVSSSEVGKNAQNELMDELSPKQRSLQSLKKELDESKVKFQRQASLLSADARLSRQEAIAEKEKALRRKMQDFQEEAQKLQQKTLAELVESIDASVENLAKEEQIELVIENDPRWVLFVNPEFEITERVVQSLEKQKGRL